MRRVIYDDGEDKLILDRVLGPEDDYYDHYIFLKWLPRKDAVPTTIYMFDRVEAELFARDLLAFVKGGE